MYLDDGKKENCCGCTACAHACPAGAIRMKTDECGFRYPEIDPARCVHCDLCRRVCPLQKNHVGEQADPAIYAVRNHDADVLQKSSSGGMFTLLADWVLGQGGVVYGVAFDEAFAVRHMRATSHEMTERFRTSKYVESDPAEIYNHIRDDLAEKLPVLLTGTPCQIAGVLSWLNAKHTDTETLYTCDNICHGVPSPMVWQDYLSVLREKYVAPEDEIVYVNMRSKKASWKEQKLEVGLKNGSIDAVVDGFSFNQLFLSLLAHRPSCFDCHFTSYARPSDFTLGDFWNAENAGLEFEIGQGVNEVLVNTEKGRRVFKQIRQNADVQPISKQAAWQPYLEYSGQKPKGYESFWKDYLATADRESLMRRKMKGSLVTRVIHWLSPMLRKTGLYNLAGKAYRVVFVRKGAGQDR